MKAYLQFVSYYFPENCISNEDLIRTHPEWSVEKISAKIGINNRYIADSNESAGDMAVKASNIFFDEHCIGRETIDFILLCTQSPDYFLPTTACILQDKIKLKNDCGAFDFNLGCSGYVYGLGIAKGLILSGQASRVLLITSETYSKYIHLLDKSCQTIFGDAAAVSLITNEKLVGGYNAEIMDFSYKTIGQGYDKLIVETGASRYPKKCTFQDEFIDGIFQKNRDYLYMDGKSIFEFTMFNIPEHIKQNIKKNNLRFSDIDLFVFHQANKYMLNFLQKRCDIPDSKFYVDLSDGGNTVSSTIPIGLKRALQNKEEIPIYIQLCGFGVGLSIGTVVLKTNNYDKNLVL